MKFEQLILELRYSATNTYLVRGSRGTILFDTGPSGTFPRFLQAVQEAGMRVQDIDYILISHFHSDHMGIVREIALKGPKLIVMDVQEACIHTEAVIHEQGPALPGDSEAAFILADTGIFRLKISESREFLKKTGLEGEILSTPGHTRDSISLFLDSGEVFVGDLNPLDEPELFKGTETEKSWKKILEKKPSRIYYGHAKSTLIEKVSPEALSKTEFRADPAEPKAASRETCELYTLVKKIMKLTDRGIPLEKICRRTGADPAFTEDVLRMYLTHQNISVRGILDRIEIKGK